MEQLLCTKKNIQVASVVCWPRDTYPLEKIFKGVQKLFFRMLQGTEWVLLLNHDGAP